MISPLRKRHRLTFLLMSVVLPIVTILGIINRKAPTLKNDLTNVSSQNLTEKFSDEVWSEDALWSDLKSISTRLLSGKNNPNILAVELSIRENLTKPDVLVYWSIDKFSPGSGPTDNSFFIGQFNSTRATLYPLPSEALKSDGYLLLYSLAHREIVATTLLPTKSNLFYF